MEKAVTRTFAFLHRLPPRLTGSAVQHPAALQRLKDALTFCMYPHRARYEDKTLPRCCAVVVCICCPVWGDAASVDSLKTRAAQGEAEAQNNLGLRYYKGQGVPQDYAEALKWFRLAAAQGDSHAQTSLGVMYSQGNGIPQDYAEALKWYRLAAAQGNAMAQYNLGNIYNNGKGVPQDSAEAVKWYRLAAAQGYALAQNSLGGMYYNGQGVPQDHAETLKWFHLAAAQGEANAQHNLGNMYVEGLGVPQDYVEAHKWFYLAAATYTEKQERDEAAKRRDIVAARMTPAQIAEAQKRAREWKKQ
jgi:TPR repeat protein